MSLEKGEGTHKNVQEAIQYYDMAGDKEHQRAREAYLRLTPPEPTKK